MLTSAFIKEHKKAIQLLCLYSLYNLVVAVIVWFRLPYSLRGEDRFYTGCLGSIVSLGIPAFLASLQMLNKWKGVEEDAEKSAGDDAEEDKN